MKWISAVLFSCAAFGQTVDVFVQPSGSCQVNMPQRYFASAGTQWGCKRAYTGAPTGTWQQIGGGGLSAVPAETFTGNAAVLTGSVAAPAFTGTALGTHTHTTTATGSVSAPSFTGNSSDNRSAFVKVIFCRKT